VRDISSLGAMPNLVLAAPATEPEVAAILDGPFRYRRGTYLRLSSIPASPFEADLAGVALGRGTVLRQGKEAVIFATAR
jgi:transketolase C-terminal domain/subunit